MSEERAIRIVDAYRDSENGSYRAGLELDARIVGQVLGSRSGTGSRREQWYVANIERERVAEASTLPALRIALSEVLPRLRELAGEIEREVQILAVVTVRAPYKVTDAFIAGSVESDLLARLGEGGSMADDLRVMPEPLAELATRLRRELRGEPRHMTSSEESYVDALMEGVSHFQAALRDDERDAVGEDGDRGWEEW